VARSFDEIRAQLLEDMRAEYRAKNLDLSTVPGSRAWFLASAIALNLLPLEARASAVGRDILPVGASKDAINRHGETDGLAREPATYARLTITGTGTPSTTATFTGRTLRSASGLSYTPDASTASVNGSGVFTLAITAARAGTDSNLPVDAVLMFDALPTNVTALQATVTSVDVVADDEELDADYAQRIADNRAERPGVGNRAEWREWVRGVSGVKDAFVFPLYHPTYGVDTLGAVTVVCVGPAQGDSTTNTRLLSGPTIDTINDYLDGVVDETGAPLTNGVALRPASMSSDNVVIMTPTTSDVDVDIRVTESSAYAFPFTSAFPRVSASTDKITVAGDQTALVGSAVLLYVGTSYARGGYEARTIASAAIVGPNTELTYDSPTSNTALNDFDGNALYPRPPNWEAMRDAVFALFDALGPGDTTPATRWPSEEIQSRATLYPGLLSAVLVRNVDTSGNTSGVAGVLSVEVVAPASAQTPVALEVLTLGVLRLRP